MKNKNSNLPIGVFDSGLGGLTVVSKLTEVLPNEDIIYFGDTGRVPYGTRSKEIIIKYAKQDIAFLKSLGVKIIVVACGSVSSVALDYISLSDMLLAEVVKPTTLAAANATKNFKIGIIGTSATINSGSYSNELKKINKNFNVFEKACPLFVPLVENGITSKNDSVVLEIANRYLSFLKEVDVDTLILGCTHYQILEDVISFVLGKNVNLINSGKETAISTFKLLKESNMLNKSKNKGKYLFYVSDEVNSFKIEAEKFLGWKSGYSIKKTDAVF
ncbi:MAG: glutamate racemase [Oscillospiraceae bacterium]|nr:glutamate racemase [Oscillospiraceae bacterium]